MIRDGDPAPKSRGYPALGHAGAVGLSTSLLVAEKIPLCIPLIWDSHPLCPGGCEEWLRTTPESLGRAESGPK